MTSLRTTIGKVLVPLLMCLLLTGIVTSEFPELRSLTDNTTNDFALIRTKSVASPVILHSSRQLSATPMDRNTLAPTLLFSCLNVFDEAMSIPSERFILHSVLRT
jgi:hypothetical protein